MRSPRHRFYVPAEQVEENRVRFTLAQAHQLGAVLRLRPGDQVRIFDGQAPVDHLVELTAVGRTGAAGEVRGTVDGRPEPRTQLHVYPALTARDTFETVLQKLVEVGVAAVTPVVTMRSLVRHGPDAARWARWQAIMREAAEQSGRSVVPRLQPARDLASALAEACATAFALVAFEGEPAHTLRPALSQAPRDGTLALFVGPEGGYDPDEIAAARRAGARTVSLGARILRTETASPIFAALVLYELGDL